jgi:hypothetical protein
MDVQQGIVDRYGGARGLLDRATRAMPTGIPTSGVVLSTLREA